MLVWYDFVVAFRGGEILCCSLEFVVEGFVVEEYPGVLVFVIPVIFELDHALLYAFELLVADEGYEGGFGFRGLCEAGEGVFVVDGVSVVGVFAKPLLGVWTNVLGGRGAIGGER